MIIYYTEYPKGQFQAFDDKEALTKTTAKVVYRESGSPDGTPFIVIRDIRSERGMLVFIALDNDR